MHEITMYGKMGIVTGLTHRKTLGEAVAAGREWAQRMSQRGIVLMFVIKKVPYDRVKVQTKNIL